MGRFDETNLKYLRSDTLLQAELANMSSLYFKKANQTLLCTPMVTVITHHFHN